MITLGKNPINFKLKKEFKDKLLNKDVKWGYGGLSEFTYYRTYARKKENGLLETWPECVIRVIEGMFSILKTHSITSHLPWQENKAHKLAEEAAERLFEFKWTPPGRGLWMMGTDYMWERGGMALYNPLHEDTKIFIKDRGWVAIKEVEGQQIEVYAKARSKNDSDKFAGASGYYKATISTAELHNAYEIEVETPNSIFSKTYKFIASENHRWFTITDKKKSFSFNNRITTKDLKIGMYLPRAYPRNIYDLDSIGVAHGYFFGDGTRTSSNLYQFTEENKNILTQYFPSISKHESNNAKVLESGLIAEYVKNLPKAWSKLPEGLYLQDKKYIYSFLAGYFAADGSVGTTYSIASARIDELIEVQKLFENLGIETKLQKSSSNSTNFSEDRDLWNLYINKHCLNINFLIKESHKRNYEDTVYNKSSISKNSKNFNKIVAITPIKPLQRVLCATVPDVENFLIEGYTITSNCTYVSTEDIDSELSKPFAYVMDTMMSGVGAGYDTMGAGKILVRKPVGDPELIVVEDTREGWVELVSCLIDSYFEEGSAPIDHDTHLVRKYGELIKGFGGVASGPEPLIQGFNAIKEILDNRDGQLLTSSDIVSIMGIIGKIVVAGNVRRCLPAESKIMTTEGLKTIANVRAGDYIITGGKKHLVLEQAYSGKQSTIIIKHRAGTLECTPNHKVAVYNDIGSYEFKLASEIKLGDRLVWDAKGYEGVEQLLPNLEEELHFNATPFSIPNKINTDIAWLLGIIQGDGYIGTDSIEIATITSEIEVLEKCNNIFQKEFGIVGKITKVKNKNAFRLRLHSAALARWFAKYVKKPKTSMHIPNFVVNATKDIRAAFLAGLFDSDGRGRQDGVIEQITTIYPSLKNDVISLLATLGIGTSVYKIDRSNKENCHDAYSIMITGNTNRKNWVNIVSKYITTDKLIYSETYNKSPIDFSYPVSWFNERPSGYKITGNVLLSSGLIEEDIYYPTIVTEILNGRIVDTFDIEVKDVKQFTTDGIVVHNSALIALGDPNDEDYTTIKNWDKNPVGMGIKAPDEMLLESKEDYDNYNSFDVDWDTKSAIAKKYSDRVWSWKIGGWLWASNNSLYAEVGQDYKKYTDSIVQNGEPGFFWLHNAKNYGRIKDGVKTDDLKVKGVNPCSEIQLESYEVCNLNENYPANHTDYWDFQRTLKFSYLYSKAVTLLPTHWKETNAIIARNRRIGSSVSGIQEAFIKFGRHEFLNWLDSSYAYLDYLDKKYSDWLGVPKSIRKTAVKPSGTVSLLAGSLPGIHHAEAVSYYRTVRIAANSPIVKILLKSNYRIEPAASDPVRTLVVYFPIIHDNNLQNKKDVSIWQQFKDTADLQNHWADNMVSVTVTFNKDEHSQIAQCLSAFDSELKSISLLPYSEHGYVQAPYIAADYNEVLSYKNSLLPLDFSVLTNEGDNAEANKFCSNDGCEI